MEDNNVSANSASKNKKILRISITIVCVCMIISGICIALFPWITRMYVGKKQEDMIDQIETIMEENAKKREQGEKVDTSTNENMTDEEREVLIKEQLVNIELEQAEEDNYSITNEDLVASQVVIGIIEIPKLDIRFPVVEGAGRWNIAYAIGHMTGTANIGGNGNCFLAGHRGGIYGEFFKYINKLENGDEIHLKDIYGDEYVYVVYDSFVVEPNETWVTDDVEEYENVLTLLTCENHGKQRLIVRARLEM